MSAFDRLLEQIDVFIRRFYKNEMLKGLFLFLAFLLASWLVVSTLEYYGRFNSWIRFFLFWSFVLGNAYLFVRYLALPLINLTRFGKRIDKYQASVIIGSFFPDVSDRLLNTLQLNDTMDVNDRSFELIGASVSQRASSFSTLQFVDAIRKDERKKYLRFLIPVGLIVLIVAVLAPSLLTKGSSSVMNYNKLQDAPYNFNIKSSLKDINEGDSLSVIVEINGLYIPEFVFINSDRGKMKMVQISKNSFRMVLENVRKDINFRFESESFQSKSYRVNVLGKCSIADLKAVLVYPKYLGRNSEVLKNPTELQVPEGTVLKWTGKSRFANSVEVKSASFTSLFKSDGFSFDTKVRSNDFIKFIIDPKFNGNSDTSTVRIEAIKDAFPSIHVVESSDTLSSAIKSFDGLLSDDYGLTKLNFSYQIVKENGQKSVRSLNVEAVQGVSHKFSFAVDFSRENLATNDRIEYWFSVWDNDGVNGNKVSKSESFRYTLPSLSELNELRDESQNDAKKSLKDALKKVEKFNLNVDKLQKEMLNQSKADFKTLEQLQQLQLEQEQLQSDLQEVQKQLEQSNQEKNQLSPLDQELLEQQKVIDELLKDLMDDELKELLKEMEELLKNNKQQQVKEDVRKLDNQSEDMKEQMTRTLESLKKLQVNEKIDDIEKELNELSKDQLSLEQDIKEGKVDSKNGEKRQEDLNNRFQELIEDMKELDVLNNELKRPLELGDFKEEQESITNEMNEAKEKLGGDKKQKASEKQKQAGSEMKKLAELLDKQQNESNKEQDSEDMTSIRLLLENVMALSFDQEYILNRFGKVRTTDPIYRKLGRRQRNIMDDTEIVKDSLLSLARRQTKTAPFIDKELKEIATNFDMMLDEIDEHRVPSLLKHQQLVMSSYNNLALLLNESLQSMQEQQKGQQKEQDKKDGKPGSGSCDKPGGNGKKPSQKPGGDIKDMKEAMKAQLDAMKKGKKPGGQKPGDTPGNKPGEKGMGLPGLSSEGVAKMVAQQTAIRQALEKMREEMNKEGEGKGNGLNPLIQELEKQERDLLKMDFTPEMIRRQENILSKLLDSEKALRVRGFEDKRESVSGKNIPIGNLIRFDEYNKKRTGQVELLRTIDPLLSPYYKGKAGAYFNMTD
jgi:hypothetical protein